MKKDYSVSVDDVLSTELGWRGFGPAQALAMFVGGFAYMTSSTLMFQMTFTYADPLAISGPPPWHCASSADSACISVLNQHLLDHGYALLTGINVSEHSVTSPGTAANQTGIQSRRIGSLPQPIPRSFCELETSQYVWNDPGLSLSSEYNLVCSQAWKASLLDTLFFAGFMLGNGIFGGVADRHGRRATLVACAAATAVVAALSASSLVPLGQGIQAAAVGGGGYWLHLVFRSVSGVLCAGQSLGGYVLATEMAGPTWRGAAGMLTQTFFIFGEFLLVALSLAFPPWRALTLSVAACCAGVLLLVPMVPESPRWLLLHNKPDKAYAALMWVARVNRVRPLPCLECTPGGEIHLIKQEAQEHLGNGRSAADQSDSSSIGISNNNNINNNRCNDHAVDNEPEGPPIGGPILIARPLSSLTTRPPQQPEIHEYYGVTSEEEETTTLVPGHHPALPGAASGLHTLLRQPVTRRLLVSTCFVLFALSVSYYGVTLALGSLVKGSLHLNFFLTAAAEMPGYLILAATTDRIGRRAAIGGGTIIAGMACLVCAFTSGGPMQMALAMVGKMGCSGAWAVGLTFAAELFPTCIRSAALSVASQSGDLGGIVTPVLLLLSPRGRFERLPFAVMGLMSLATLALLVKLPETRGMPQLDTFDQLLEWLRSSERTSMALPPLPSSLSLSAAVDAAPDVEVSCQGLYGVPATNVDGIPAIIHDGVLGFRGSGCGDGGGRSEGYTASFPVMGVPADSSGSRRSSREVT